VWIDCSPEAQERRKHQLAELEAKRYSGVSSVSDRSRSVGYDQTVIEAGINRLRHELAMCAPGFRRVSRITYNPLAKGL
jgi:hypothetical protein